MSEAEFTAEELEYLKGRYGPRLSFERQKIELSIDGLDGMSVQQLINAIQVKGGPESLSKATIERTDSFGDDVVQVSWKRLETDVEHAARLAWLHQDFASAAEKAAEHERRERELFARLKAKYEGQPS